MKVRFLTSMVGSIDRNPGDVDLVDDAEAGRLIAAGYAEKTDAPRGRVAISQTEPHVETAEASGAGVEIRAKRAKGRAKPPAE